VKEEREDERGRGVREREKEMKGSTSILSD
jgi:hypothetical protein